MSTRFSKKFEQLLSEQEDPIGPEGVTRNGDSAAFVDSLEDGSTEDTFSSDGGQPGSKAKHLDRFHEIINKFEEFAVFLNSDTEDSVNLFLHSIDKDNSMFSGVSRTSSKVTSVAESLASLAESFKGYVLTGKKKQREQELALKDY